jgi:hypothetical protein
VIPGTSVGREDDARTLLAGIWSWAMDAMRSERTGCGAALATSRGGSRIALRPLLASYLRCCE